MVLDGWSWLGPKVNEGLEVTSQPELLQITTTTTTAGVYLLTRLDVSAFSLFFLLGVFDGARSEPRVGFMFAREKVEINKNVKLM